MKIYVIDNIDQILPELLISASDVSIFSDEIQAINAIEHKIPDIILLNYSVRGKDTPRYIDLILSISPSSNIILIGESLTDEQVLACLLLGAKGYQNFRDLSAYIDKLIKVVGSNEAWISRKLTAKLIDAIRQQHSLDDHSLYQPEKFIAATNKRW